jgi:HTH-type transcriptional regulator, transcriptional repressor of NAD biosynthesis genes
MTTGLVLGKFAPLHRGHQLLIETSLVETQQTVVLIYDCPDLAVPPLPVRAQWIRDLYPQVHVLEAWDGPTETGLDPAITQQHDHYLQRRLADWPITHFFSSEPYGEHVSRALQAVDRRVDVARNRVPISATAIRTNPFAQRQFLHPRVYRDLLTHVVFLGAPSTGKTTLACEMAKRLQTVWMPEYGREYWEAHQSERRLSREQLLEIALEHLRREDALLMDANQYFFVDTDATTTLQFSLYYHGDAVGELWNLAQQCRHRYDVFFLCLPDIPYDDTWDRSGDANRIEMHRRITSDLRTRKIHFYPISGDLEERCTQVCDVLDAHRRQRESSLVERP